MRRFKARSKVLFPAPDGPTTAVTTPPGIPASTLFRISAPPTAYPRPETLIPSGPMLEHLPPQVGVQAVEDGVGVAGQSLVVREDHLHAADDGVEAVGLRTTVPLVHEVGVVDDLGYLPEHRVVQLVLLQERLEGAVLAAVGEPGPHHVEQLRLLRCLGGVAEEGEGGLRVQEAPYQPHTGGAVHVASPARGPEH